VNVLARHNAERFVKSSLLYVFLDEAICSKQAAKQSWGVIPIYSLVRPNLRKVLTANSKQPVSIYSIARSFAKYYPPTPSSLLLNAELKKVFFRLSRSSK
jgi:hypothetical protein